MSKRKYNERESLNMDDVECKRGRSSTQDPHSSKNEDQEYTILDILNYDCMMHIFSYLNVIKLFETETVSKRWRELVDLKLQETREFELGRSIKLKTEYSILMRCGMKLRKITVCNYIGYVSPYTPRIISQQCLNLTHLYLYNSSFVNWKIVFINCTQLKTLTLDTRLVQDYQFKDIKCNLEELTLLYIDRLRGSFLEYLDGNSLKELNIKQCSSIYGCNLKAHLGKFKKLIKLTLNNCNESVDIVLDQVAELVPNLTEFAYCNVLTSSIDLKIMIRALEHFKELEVLVLQCNHLVNDETLEFISRSLPKLTTLDISGNKNVIRVTDITNKGISCLWKLPNLKTLIISYLMIGDEAFDKIGTHGEGSKLQTLVCRHNTLITSAGLLKVVQMCPDIRKIEFDFSINVDNAFVKSAGEAIALHPNRTEKLILNRVHYRRYCENDFASLKHPFIRVIFEEDIEEDSEDDIEEYSEDDSEEDSEDDSEEYSEDDIEEYSEDDSEEYSEDDIEEYSEDDSEEYSEDDSEEDSEDDF